MARRYIEKVEAHAQRVFAPSHATAATPLDLIRLYRSFLKKENHRIRLQHAAGLSGPEVCRQRSDLLDVVLRKLFANALQESQAEARVALLASGGYGRALLNPGSDIDLQFIHPERGGRDLSESTRDLISKVITMLWDVGFKVSQGVRSLKETFQFALKDHTTLCALIEARFITGDRELFDEFEDNFRRQCITGHEKKFLKERVRNIKTLHAAASNTIHLQEPNVKTGCGGLRDFHNIIWISYVKLGIRDLDQLVRRRIFSEIAGQEIRKAHDFLLRVRNSMHYAEKSGNDLLTLRLQGTVATDLGYKGRRMIERTETFMRDYYHHTRNLYQHNLSLMEHFQLEQEEKKPGIFGFLAAPKKGKRDAFDGFHARDGFIFADHDDVFQEDDGRLMRLFQHLQVRGLKLSPQVRRLVKLNYNLINRTFRYRKTNRETWEAILSRKGQVGPALRAMHRTGFLGRYMPEFMPLTDLVQHEFFHRYAADEHTLKCIEQLDELSDTREPRLAFHQRLFHDLEDPYVLYLALLLHDTGRAEGGKNHAYASTALTDQVCRRLQISDGRRQMLLFLVDNHLLLWQTATTRNLDDPEVVEEFVKIVRRRDWLEALYLHTCADSRGTNETGWTDWKESLVRQLYHSTLAWFEGREAFATHSHLSRETIRRAADDELDDSYDVELDAHITGMPPRYFNFRDPASVIQHLRTCRQFFRQLRKEDTASALRPVLRWTAHPEQGCSELTLVSWDRHLLLAKAAGALAANGINILSADLFLREDGLVIDLFRVCTLEFAPVTSEKTTGSVGELLSRACSGEEIDFAKLIRGRKETGAIPAWQEEFPVHASAYNEPRRRSTTVEVQAPDRIGLLYDVFSAIGNLGLEITHARISTEKGAAVDTLCVTTADGEPVTDPAALQTLKHAVRRAVAPA
jgi:[protein-PII] uridylyltransferase